MKLIAVVLTVLALSACSTVAGIGKDITKASEWTEEKIKGTPL